MKVWLCAVLVSWTLVGSADEVRTPKSARDWAQSAVEYSKQKYRQALQRYQALVVKMLARQEPEELALTPCQLELQKTFQELKSGIDLNRPQTSSPIQQVDELVETLRLKEAYDHILSQTLTPFGAAIVIKNRELPLTDPQLLQERQDAIRFLVEHPEIHQRIREALKNLASQLRTDIEKDLGESVEVKRISRFARTTGVAGLSLMGVPLLITAFIQTGKIFYTILAGLAGIVAAKLNLGLNSGQREEIKIFVPFFDFAKAVQQDLKDSGAEPLNEIGQYLSGVVDPTINADLAHLHALIESRMNASWGDRILERLRLDRFPAIKKVFMNQMDERGVSALILDIHALREQLEKNKKTVLRLISSIAALDSYSATAETAITHNYSIAKIRPGTQMYLRLANSIHPRYLHTSADDPHVQRYEYQLVSRMALEAMELKDRPPDPNSFFLVTNANYHGGGTFIRNPGAQMLFAMTTGLASGEVEFTPPQRIITHFLDRSAVDLSSDQLFEMQAEKWIEILKLCQDQVPTLILTNSILESASVHDANEQSVRFIKYLVHKAPNTIGVLGTTMPELGPALDSLPGIENITINNTREFHFLRRPRQLRSTEARLRILGAPDDLFEDDQSPVFDANFWHSHGDFLSDVSH